MTHPKPPRAGTHQELVGSFKRRGIRVETKIPINIERVLLMAGSDSKFKQSLFENRDATLSDEGLGLTPSEAAILRALPLESLASMVDRLNTNRQKNRKFLRKVAAAVVAGGVLLTTTCTVPDAQSMGDDGDIDVDSDTDGDVDSDSDSDTDPDAGSDAG